MTWLSLGSLALPMTLNRHGVKVRTDLSRLGQEVTTGRAAKPARHLRGDLDRLTRLEAQDSRLLAQRSAIAQLATHVDRAQAAIAHVSALSQGLGADLLAASLAGPGTQVATTAAQSAESVLNDIVATLRQRHDGQALFSGAASDRSPIPQADAILSALATVVAGAGSAREIADRVLLAMTGPGEMFETILWQGADPGDGALIGDDGQRAGALPTLLDPALRTAMAGAIMGAMAADASLPATEQGQLLRLAAETLSGNTAGMARVESDIGTVQNRIATRQTQVQAERDGLELARQALVGVDPYDAAAHLQATQVQLEMIYAVTARTASLSLTEYLR
ncbi:MAG: flagellin [Paracoccaceae bacterium]